MFKQYMKKAMPTLSMQNAIVKVVDKVQIYEAYDTLKQMHSLPTSTNYKPASQSSNYEIVCYILNEHNLLKKQQICNIAPYFYPCLAFLWT